MRIRQTATHKSIPFWPAPAYPASTPVPRTQIVHQDWVHEHQLEMWVTQWWLHYSSHNTVPLLVPKRILVFKYGSPVFKLDLESHDSQHAFKDIIQQWFRTLAPCQNHLGSFSNLPMLTSHLDPGKSDSPGVGPGFLCWFRCAPRWEPLSQRMPTLHRW